MYSAWEKFFTLLRYALQASEELPQIERKEWDNIGASDEFSQVISSSDWNSIFSLAAMKHRDRYCFKNQTFRDKNEK